MITFVIVGLPVAKGRPKFFRKGNFMGTYTPSKTKEYEDSVISQALPHKPAVPLDIPLAVELRFYFPVPQSASKKFKLKAISGMTPVAKRPDLDNLIKSVLDPLNTIFWTDDKLIVELTAKKYYSEPPRIEVMIAEIKSGERGKEVEGC